MWCSSSTMRMVEAGIGSPEVYGGRPPASLARKWRGPWHGSVDPRRLFGLGLPSLARAIPSAGGAAPPVARTLRGGLRYRRTEQQLLPPAAAGDLRGVGGPRTR